MAIKAWVWTVLLLWAWPLQADWLSDQRQALQKAAVQMELLADMGHWPYLEGATLKPGQQSDLVPAIRERLWLTGDLSDLAEPGDIYDEQLVAAVKAFQGRHGLKEDGIVGQATRQALNVTPAQRLLQIQGTLQRMAQLQPAPEQLVVNIPAFSLTWFDGDQVRLHSKIVVGRPSRPTPQMETQVTAIELNPYWNVPYSIFRRDYLPKVRRLGVAELVEHQIDIVEGYGNQTRVVPMPDELPSPWPPHWRLRQRAGDFNALGRLKFVLPNNDAIYLHHTNQPSLFRQARRAYSSGCIRVEEAYSLAAQLLFDHPDWRDRVASGQRVKIPLTVPLPIALVYWTAWLDDEGRLQFRDDLYGLDLGANSQYALHKD
ncbi:L,D-transpeptidase family protein [Gallaecimonas xiamenensis]|uniref:ErfK/YbiS/YcfS/YnhG family protein n=1 Tax=Gallaecimonas xiamenensis 3-C-1 TaxID=745411 RepID=K2IU00_9GAMM|nr:L,D-transpeptidase family protein [Gallaecimonas xiamenensis]EKE73716.1 ErfK/YbiS/YcfS/YnhG family protein [Gallaecimonas xiamenensis 3-C-1]